VSGRPVSVVKLGGSVLASGASLATAVGELAREVAAGYRVLAVVSARRGVTDHLDGEARRIAQHPDSHAYAALLATGEAHSAAALAIATAAAGLATRLLEARELGLRTAGEPTDAVPCAMRRRSLRAALVAHDVVVVPGFVGYDAAGRPTLLGRGGSDSTAIYLAHALAAERCRLVKDVPGWHVSDPRRDGGAPRYRVLNWDEAIAAPAEIVQAKAVLLARRLGRPFEVGAVGSSEPTRVGPLPTVVEPWAAAEALS
jgi:homoserine dehydrogenase